MDVARIILELDSEIERLQQARNLLRFPAGASASQQQPASHQSSSRKRRTMSAAARARIGAATKARWAAGKQGKMSQDRLKRLRKSNTALHKAA